MIFAFSFATVYFFKLTSEKQETQVF